MASNDKEKSSVQLPVMIAAGVAVIVLIGWLGHKYLAPQVQGETTAGDKKTDFYNKVAKEAGPTGDLSKVPEPDHQKFIDSIGAAPKPPEEILKLWIKSHPVK